MERDLPAYRDISWSLWNERTSLQIDGLTYTYAWLFLATIPRGDWSYWSVWHEGLTRWTKLNDFEHASEFVSEMLKRAADYAKIPGERERLAAEAEREIQTFELEDAREAMKLDSTKFNDNRKHRRYVQHFPVEIDIDGVAFLTSTVDISMGGMRLNDALPSTFTDSFEAVLHHPDGSVLAVNSLVIKRINAPLDRVRFLLDPQTEASLRTWLLNTPEITD